MVWPNRGAFGAIGGYGLNVLKLLQGSHRCCRYAPARGFNEAHKTIRQAQAPSPVFFIEAPGRPVFLIFCRPPPTAGRGVQKDPRASTPRDIEACRSVCSCRKSTKPKASRARCFRLAPHPPRWSAPPREGETCCVTTPPSLGPSIRRHSCDRSTVRLSAVTGPRRADRHARRGAAWTAGPRTASPMQGHVPATAPRPASGDADQTPLGNGAGYSVNNIL